MPEFIYISRDVQEHHLMQTGDAIEAFTQWKPKRNEIVFRYNRADILIISVNSSIYLMSKAESTRTRIPFIPIPLASLAQIARELEALA